MYQTTIFDGFYFACSNYIRNKHHYCVIKNEHGVYQPCFNEAIANRYGYSVLVPFSVVREAVKAQNELLEKLKKAKTEAMQDKLIEKIADKAVIWLKKTKS